ncbi:F0F1 ATP synthase subunit A [Paenibacillus helianthi]|uniref:ATP synthase subunit a n=1 Tax=Paenibacillus helianthi TaxID=1349432 RepID=A0ABX3EM10_9BACL|nr:MULTISPECIES: F0F1 ATP synthase subunit A [Paenibacillus]OKP78135.1 F0F1 ATP synthase subunit A [Paenibacillus sp. P3E]OKP85605.1 F0F1 ATP synthase subunit A [Paenibacillus sp. P32E]OKP85878.1 F0F1 ATP synthase subunit A [Paenibacillus helianthi]
MHISPMIEVGGLDFDLSIILMLIVTCTIVFVLARLATRNLSVENPGKLQNFMEWLVEFVQGMMSSTMDLKKGKPFLGLGLTLILFIFVGNMLGLPFGIVTEYHDVNKATFFGHQLVNVVEEIHKVEAANPGKEVEVGVTWWKSPTADASVSMGLAGLIFVLVHFLGLTRNTKGYLKHYLQPFAVFLPINLIEQFSKLLTHGMRLFGNIFAGEVLIAQLVKLGSTGIIGGIASIPLLMVWQGFSIFVGSIQAFVFVMLTFLYISQVIDTHEEH